MNVIDVSNYNKNINWINVKNAGFSCVYIKATEGTTYIDPLLDSHYQGAVKAGMQIGFYHFLTFKSAPETQAQNFFDNIKNKSSALRPCLDVEVTGNNPNNYIRRFIAKFKTLSDMPLIIYSGAYFARDNIATDIKSSYPLWVAHYGVDPWNSGINTNFNVVTGHQYTNKGTISGISGVFDMDVFNNNILLQNSWQFRPVYVHNAKISELQRICNNLTGSNLNVDGFWGPLTDAAVKKLPLAGLKYRTPDLTVWVQLRLGINPDGILGPKTELAVKSWQQKHSLKVDGIVGYNTIKSLAYA